MLIFGVYMILIGSRAAKYLCPDFPRGEKSDWDWVTDEPGPKKGDSHYCEEVYSALLPYCQETELGLIPSLEALYTLKVSHAFWKSIHWAKNMRDCVWFQEKGVAFLPDLYKELYAYWEIRKGKKPAYLDVPNEKFFTSSVKRKYVHDDIHKVMAYYDQPLYMRCKKDLSRALLSRKMFESLSPLDKDRLAREETYVTALERFLIPSDFKESPLIAYSKATNLLVTSMSKSWFPLYIVLNYCRLKDPDIDYVKKFKEKEHTCQLIS